MPNTARVMELDERQRYGFDGLDIFRYEDDFFEGGYSANATETAKFSETADRGAWLVTVGDGGIDQGETITIDDDEPGGVLKLTNNDADNDFLSLQLNGEAFKLRANKKTVFKARIKIDDVDKADWFVGLATTDTTGASPILAGATESVGFRITDGTSSTSIEAVSEDASTETTSDTGVSVSDDTFVDLMFIADGTDRIDFIVNSTRQASLSTNIPADDAVTLTLEVRNAEAAAHSLSVDYVLVTGDR